jgi:hypothetical protein
MPKLIFRKSKTLDQGIYPARLLGVETRDNDYGPGLRWLFEITESGGQTTQRTAYSSMATGEKSKCGRWVEALLGDAPADGQEIDLDELRNLHCRVEIGHKVGDKGTAFDVILEVLPVAAPGKARPASSRGRLSGSSRTSRDAAPQTAEILGAEFEEDDAPF